MSFVTVTFMTVAARHEREEVVKGSRFIAFALPVATLGEVHAALADVRAAHPDASHHCYAYKVGGEVRFSDDGEPGGTAGRPLLEVLEKRGLDNVLAVVARYFGGTKLGAGGLVRAYGGSLAKCLDEAGTVTVFPRTTLTVRAPFADMDTLHRFLAAWPHLEKGAPDYAPDGVVLSVSLRAHDEASFRAALTEVTHGRAGWLKPGAG
jgi:uncharacterized YigZ family protein